MDHVDLLLGTRAPVEVGLQAVAEGPGRVQLGLGIGVLPGAYVAAINGTAVSLGWYDEATATLIRSSIRRSVVLSTDLGWRVAPDTGLVLGLGYGAALLGGGTTGAEVIAAATGDAAPDRAAELAYRARASLHLLRPEVGWQQPFGSRGVVQVAVGLATTVAAGAVITPEDTLPRPGFDAANQLFADAASAWLADTLRRVVHTPTVRLGIGLRL